jgi:hypothetical protein
MFADQRGDRRTAREFPWESSLRRTTTSDFPRTPIAKAQKKNYKIEESTAVFVLLTKDSL